MKIHYITPYSTIKNYGGEFNDRISELPNDSWICLRDGDTMFLNHDWGKQIQDVIIKHGDKYQLIGCMTNRVNRRHQLVNGIFNSDWDIQHHYSISKVLHENDYDTVIDVTSKSRLAGLFMLFHKSTWEKCKFVENNRRFDDLFCRDIINKGGKLGLMKGLYLFHWYRGWSNDPTNDFIHLE